MTTLLLQEEFLLQLLHLPKGTKINGANFRIDVQALYLEIEHSSIPPGAKTVVPEFEATYCSHGCVEEVRMLDWGVWDWNTPDPDARYNCRCALVEHDLMQSEPAPSSIPHICDIAGCNRSAIWTACAKEDHTDKLEIAHLHYFCGKHISMVPAHHQIEAIRSEQILLNHGVEGDEEDDADV